MYCGANQSSQRIIMHITGGKLRRRAIKTVDKKGSVPPSKVEAIFSMIGHDLTVCPDAFGGSGIMTGGLV